ncbi:MAG TPA: hypothetical protein VGM03_10870, partial [Phycisphaerae bacterium]
RQYGSNRELFDALLRDTAQSRPEWLYWDFHEATFAVEGDDVIATVHHKSVDEAQPPHCHTVRYVLRRGDDGGWRILRWEADRAP